MLLQFIDQSSTYDWTLGKVWLLYSVAGKVYWQTALAMLSRHFASFG